MAAAINGLMGLRGAFGNPGTTLGYRGTAGMPAGYGAAPVGQVTSSPLGPASPAQSPGTGLAGLMGFLGQLAAPNMGFPSAGLAASPQGYGPYGNIGQATIAGPPTGMAQASPSIGNPLGNMASLASPLGMQALGQQRGFNSNAPSAMSSNMGFNAPSATNGFTAPGSPGMAGQPGRGTSGGYNPYQTLMQAYGGNLNGALR